MECPPRLQVVEEEAVAPGHVERLRVGVCLDADDVVRRGETDERVLPLPVAVDVDFAVVAANLEQVESLAHAVVAVVRSQRVAGEPARLLVIVEELPSGENPDVVFAVVRDHDDVRVVALRIVEHRLIVELLALAVACTHQPSVVQVEPDVAVGQELEALDRPQRVGQGEEPARVGIEADGRPVVVGEPDVAAAVLPQRGDEVVGNPDAVAVLQAVVGEVRPVEAAEPVRGAEPQVALLVLDGGVDGLLRQSVGRIIEGGDVGTLCTGRHRAGKDGQGQEQEG